MNNKLNKEYDTYLFDLDGTIIDSSPGIVASVNYALEKFGIKEADQESLLRFIGPPLTESFQKYYGMSVEDSVKAVYYYRENYEAGGMFQCSVYEGLEDTLKALCQAKKKVLVATSKPEVYARQILKHFGMDVYFDYIAGMELDGGRGTKAEVIAYGLESCGITDKSKILMIGDREHDIFGAKAMGVDSMGVLYGFGSLEEFESAGATYIVKSPREIFS